MAILGEVIEVKNNIRKKHLNRIFYGTKNAERAQRKLKADKKPVSAHQMAMCFIEMLRAYKRLRGKVDTASMTFEKKVAFLIDYYEDNEKINMLYDLHLAIETGNDNELINSVKQEVKSIAISKHSRAIMYHASI